jgi:type VI secretion system protein ImpM
MGVVFGAFGKIPSIGDFFRIDAPQGFVSVWDDWVQRTMLVAQSALGGDWDDHYMSAPIWRFSLSAGLAGPRKIIGVAMPSVDRVGRRFPLTLMAPLLTSGPVLRDHFGNIPLFESLEGLALDTLDDGMSRDILAVRLRDVPEPDCRDAAPVRVVGGALAVAGTGGPLPDLAAGLLADRYTHPSVWTAMTQESDRLLICEGLPAGPQMQALYNMAAPIWTEGQAQ